MAKKVNVYTSATNPDTGETVNLAPGDEAPDWAQLGDHVYADGDEDTVPAEPVAGPSQSALTPRQEKERQAAEKAQKAEQKAAPAPVQGARADGR